MTQYERMINGLLYDPLDQEVIKNQVCWQNRRWEFNQLRPTDYEAKTAYMKEVFAECGTETISNCLFMRTGADIIRIGVQASTQTQI